MKLLIIVFIIIMLAVLLEMNRELSNFQIVRYELKIPELKNNKKVLFLSDLHNHVYGNENQELLQAICNEQPDIILIGGDMLVGKEGIPYETALSFVKKLPSVSPVYYASGNHEQRMKEQPERYDYSYIEYYEELKAAGIRFLENESANLLWDGKKIKITGLLIPLRCYTHFHKEKLEVSELIDRIGKKEADKYEILLAHNPSYMKQYLERGADLILSGHLHGGIVRIPGVAGAISPSFEIFPKYSGDLYHEGKTDIVVSKGLGTHTFNIRLFNPAELIVLELKGD